jgi:hypothetical protein
VAGRSEIRPYWPHWPGRAGFHDMSQNQIAQKIGLSQMQDFRLLSAILTQLRKTVADDGSAGEHDRGW